MSGSAALRNSGPRGAGSSRSRLVASRAHDAGGRDDARSLSWQCQSARRACRGKGVRRQRRPRQPGLGLRPYPIAKRDEIGAGSRERETASGFAA